MIAFVINNAAKMSASTFKSQQYDLQVTLHLLFQKNCIKILQQNLKNPFKKEGETRSGENYPG